MSKYSGKCDLADMFECQTDEETLKKIKQCKFVIDGEETNIESVKDLVPFYPCIVGSSAWYNGEGNIHFSSRSYVIREEDERIGFRFKEAKKVYRKLKRNKEKISPQSVYDGMYHWDENLNYMEWLIATNVAHDGENAYVGHISISLGQHYRKALYDEMIKYGYTQDQAIGWVYEYDKNALKENYHLT